MNENSVYEASIHKNTIKVFPTRSCRHLIPTLNMQQGLVEIKNFSDGQLSIQLQEEVNQEPIWVLASMPAPGDTILELCLLLDALQRAGAQINLFLTYFGYARQDRAEQGQSLSSQVIFRFLQEFVIKKSCIIHIHNPGLRRFFDFDDIILVDFFLPYAHMVDVIVAPDKGAVPVAKIIAALAKKELMIMSKTRISDEIVECNDIENINLAHKKVLIVDDMIATGETIICVAKILKKNGAQEINVAATHGIFCGNAFENIQQSCIDHVFVTNTLKQAPQKKGQRSKIEIVDCASMIRNLMDLKYSLMHQK